jgi:uncharacterized protein YjbI with pentapeptide repeats
LAIDKGYTEPEPESVNARQLDLDKWHFRGKASDRPLILPRADFSEATLDHASFTDVRVMQGNFTKAKIRCTIWERANLTEANFDHTQATASMFRECDLTAIQGDTANWQPPTPPRPANTRRK